MLGGGDSLVHWLATAWYSDFSDADRLSRRNFDPCWYFERNTCDPSSLPPTTHDLCVQFILFDMSNHVFQWDWFHISELSDLCPLAKIVIPFFHFLLPWSTSTTVFALLCSSIWSHPNTTLKPCFQLVKSSPVLSLVVCADQYQGEPLGMALRKSVWWGKQEWKGEKIHSATRKVWLP